MAQSSYGPKQETTATKVVMAQSSYGPKQETTATKAVMAQSSNGPRQEATPTLLPLKALRWRSAGNRFVKNGFFFDSRELDAEDGP